ncbi:hypothetical protein BU24DRAFT_485773 [Aaosphaeria arxii CBS 175.79]|uniref:DUF6594 domain-containing protein n=1 Tax=Aaosphaeria arxii CBS 175.79 TaxID=1450172 RepID=A0A6A5XHX5_9PLEO|nr:uncharacterized protein BU24DRAFT_485773 [Aaosphaeria arxii CBS 175.79]KAF2012370.1 hypothetical protein BU24DRAFT_485773 [Aaosphaeria arxii CBS 175.79]
MGKQRRRTAQSTKKQQPKERSPSSSSADSTSSGQGNHEAGTSNHEDQNVDSPLTSPASTRTYQRPDEKGSEHSGSELSYQIQPRVSKEPKSTLTGYELMADKLAGSANATGTVGTHQGIVPMYRKFEQLNHRVLLHLQDEISELEEELRYLDECIAHASPRDEYGRFQPASRRRDARYGNDLHFRRTEVLGKVFMKLNQYNQALSSYSNMIKDLGPAKAGDIQTYQKWMEQRTPIEGPEAQFLKRKNDLVAIPRRESRSLIIGGLPQQSQAIYLPLILVLPLMAFAIVPGLLGRLFVIAMIAAVEVKIVMTTELKDFMTAREWVMCGSW